MTGASGNSTAAYAGSSKSRQERGAPGHCDDCARYGHVKAHPDLGCGDVGCIRSHEPYDSGSFTREDSATIPARVQVCMRCTGLGRPLVGIPHGGGNAFQRAAVATVFRYDDRSSSSDGVLVITPHVPGCSELDRAAR